VVLEFQSNYSGKHAVPSMPDDS